MFNRNSAVSLAPIVSLTMLACSNDDRARDGSPAVHVDTQSATSSDESAETSDAAGSTAETGELATSTGSTGGEDTSPAGTTSAGADTESGVESAGDTGDPCAEVTCGRGQACMEGSCVDVGAACNAVVVGEKRAACAACMEDACCEALTACNGDVTVDPRPAACGVLTACLADELNNPASTFEPCRDASFMTEIEQCANAACPDSASALDLWWDVGTCRFEMCFEPCA